MQIGKIDTATITNIDELQRRRLQSPWLFICQPSIGLSKNQVMMFKMESEQHAEKVLETSFHVLEDVGKNTGLNEMAKLGESIKRISCADIIMFPENWDMSHECVVEHEVVMQYGFTMLRDEQEYLYAVNMNIDVLANHINGILEKGNGLWKIS